MLNKNKFDENCIELLIALPNRHSKHCFRSAINHLDCADKLIDIDLEMHVFRGITAEEEAATGLMHCLKERGYKNSEKLKPKDHTQKNAVLPFISILGTFFQETFIPKRLKPRLLIQEQDGEMLLTIGIPVQDNLIYPTPPLNFSISTESQPLSYKRKIANFVKTSGTKNITSHIKEQANLRNQVLYASPEGYPKLEKVKPGFLELRQKRVLIMIRAYLLITPYNEHQPFVQEALDAFLSMLGAIESNNLHSKL